jgi:hypothetical protein
MKYQVIGGSTKNEEFEKYVEVLTELGIPTERDKNGRVGVVDTRDQAQQILERIKARIHYMPWSVIEIVD